MLNYTLVSTKKNALRGAAWCVSESSMSNVIILCTLKPPVVKCVNDRIPHGTEALKHLAVMWFEFKIGHLHIWRHEDNSDVGHPVSRCFFFFLVTYFSFSNVLVKLYDPLCNDGHRINVKRRGGKKTRSSTGFLEGLVRKQSHRHQRARVANDGSQCVTSLSVHSD